MTPKAEVDDWKRRVADRFSAAAAGYDGAAASQQTIARGLAAVLVPRLTSHSHQNKRLRGAEIGCGTGFLTAELVPHLGAGSGWLATDIAPAMLDATAARLAGMTPPGVRLSTLRMDGEWPTLEPGQWDLICSSLAVQWFYDLRGGLARLFDLLAPGGILAVTTLGSGSFSAWQAACEAEQVPSFAHRYPSLDTVRGWFPSAHVSEQWHGLGDDACGVGFLATLRAIGADSPPPEHGAHRASVSRLRRAVRRLAGGSGGDYHVLTIVLEKQP